METLIIDIDSDLEIIRKEVESIERKLSRLKTEKDPEPDRIIGLAEQGIKSYRLFREDIENFKDFLRS